MAAVAAAAAKSKISADSEVQITKEDQGMINTFANTNAKVNDVKSDIKKKTKELMNLQDAADDLLLQDEDDLVPFRIGEIFVKISADNANQLIEKQKDKLLVDISQLKAEVNELKKTLAELKVKLYGKFGNNINLEEEED